MTATDEHMRRRRIRLLAVLAAIVAACAVAAGWRAWNPAPRKTVVVYVALDETYARPILDAFENESGLRVLAHYDTEASKTIGLVNRLIAEKPRPRADVFWNNETAHTIRLKNEGVLEAYTSPAAANIPPRFRDPQGYWTGFAARARVIIYNTDTVQEPPTSVRALIDPAWRGRAAMANPLFGTTATHAGAWFAAWGDGSAKDFMRAVKANDVAVLPGNAAVKDLVARGEYAWGLTDTDDANGAVEDGFPVAWRLPDQEPGGLGTLMIPNTVALVRGGPHAESGRRLIDFLLRPETESALAASRSIQIPLQSGASAPDRVPSLDTTVTSPIEFDEIAAKIPAMMEFVRNEFAP